MPELDLLKAQRQVWAARIRAPEKLVMLALLDHWSKASAAPFPSVGRLAWMTTQCTRTVIRAIASLEAMGAVVVARRSGVSSSYSLHPDRCQTVTSDSESPVSESHHPSDSESPPPVTESHPKEPSEVTQEGTHLGASPKPPKKTKPRRGPLWHFVPEGWEPKDSHRSKARELGVSLDAELEKFRNHEFKAAKSDADRAFNTWLTTAANWQAQRPVQPRQGATTRKGFVRDGRPVQPNHGQVDLLAMTDAEVWE